MTLVREWKSGDIVEVDLPVEVRKVVADARVKENRGRMAIERGPLVYCAEWREADGGHVLDLLVDPAREMTTSVDGAPFAGVTVIHAQARRMGRPSAPARPITLIPYYLWANRGAGEMTVWLSREEYALGDTGPAGGVIFYINPNYETDAWRYLEAAPVDQSAGAKWGCFRSYWASSQQTADMAAHIDFADNGRQHFDDKDFPRRVRAIRSF